MCSTTVSEKLESNVRFCTCIMPRSDLAYVPTNTPDIWHQRKRLFIRTCRWQLLKVPLCRKFDACRYFVVLLFRSGRSAVPYTRLNGFESLRNRDTVSRKVWFERTRL